MNNKSQKKKEKPTLALLELEAAACLKKPGWICCRHRQIHRDDARLEEKFKECRFTHKEKLKNAIINKINYFIIRQL